MLDRHFIPAIYWAQAYISIYNDGYRGEDYDDILPEHDEEHKLHRLLGAIFLTKVPKEVKFMIMEQEYNITLEDEIRKDVESMCSLSQYVKEEGIEIGKEIGEAIGMKRGIAQERERSEKLLAEKDVIIEKLRKQLAAL